MTRDDVKKLLPIITAFANGETIEVSLVEEHRLQLWRSTEDITFNLPRACYRIKPKPLEVKLWVNQQTGEACQFGAAKGKVGTVSFSGNYIVKLFREVIE